MQRQDCLTRLSKSPDREPLSLDLVLARSSNEEDFYAASVNFLKKRLQDKTLQKEPSQSCCDFLLDSSKDKGRVKKQKSVAEIDFTHSNSKTSELQMCQVLPTPKSNKDRFFKRVKNTFRRYRQVEMNDANCDEESKKISNFKFPRCERADHYRRPYLGEISEEHSTNASARTSRSKISETS
ncbi:hypothetical protein O0L34_g1461 [Tuta absoluta]|nr:hypothetical protein O0L34_g1461 [Tuta absoluta]